jgi:hypothetical protein
MSSASFQALSSRLSCIHTSSQPSAIQPGSRAGDTLSGSVAWVRHKQAGKYVVYLPVCITPECHVTGCVQHHQSNKKELMPFTLCTYRHAKLVHLRSAGEAAFNHSQLICST